MMNRNYLSKGLRGKVRISKYQVAGIPFSYLIAGNSMVYSGN